MKQNKKLQKFDSHGGYWIEKQDGSTMRKVFSTVLIMWLIMWWASSLPGILLKSFTFAATSVLSLTFSLRSGATSANIPPGQNDSLLKIHQILNVINMKVTIHKCHTDLVVQAISCWGPWKADIDRSLSKLDQRVFEPCASCYIKPTRNGTDSIGLFNQFSLLSAMTMLLSSLYEDCTRTFLSPY